MKIFLEAKMEDPLTQHTCFTVSSEYMIDPTIPYNNSTKEIIQKQKNINSHKFYKSVCDQNTNYFFFYKFSNKTIKVSIDHLLHALDWQ